MDKFKAGMDDKFASHTTRRVILFIFFYLLLAIAYLFLWVPLVSKLSKDVKNSASGCDLIIYLLLDLENEVYVDYDTNHCRCEDQERKSLPEEILERARSFQLLISTVQFDSYLLAL